MADSLTFLGTADGVASPDRHHASLLLRLAGQTLLLDCGEPCSQTLKHLGVDFNSLDAIVVSHTHSDHVGGLPMLLQSLWLEQRTRPLSVWMPRRAIPPLQRWLRACFLFEEQFGFRIRWRPLTARSIVRTGSVRLRAFPTSHLKRTQARFARKYPRVGFDAFCLVAEAGGKRIGYSADLGAPQDLGPMCAKPLDLLVVELAHFHPRALVEVLRGREIGHLVITHLGPAARARFAEVKTLLTRQLHPRRLTFATDGAIVRF